MKMKTNFHADNNKFQYHILSDEKMKKIGFDKNFYNELIISFVDVNCKRLFQKIQIVKFVWQIIDITI